MRYAFFTDDDVVKEMYGIGTVEVAASFQAIGAVITLHQIEVC